MKKSKILKQVLPAAFIVLSAAIFTYAQDSTSKQNVRPDPSNVPAVTTSTVASDTKYSYEFTQPKFYIKHIVLEHGSLQRES